jgi:hypothetical protein
MTFRRGPLRLSRLLSAAACAAVVLAGCGSQPSGPQPGAARTGTPGPRTTGPATPRQRAVADAARIMASFPRPPGAVRTGLIASLTEPGEWPGGLDLARVTRWWRVPGRPQAALAWIRAHLPSGFTAAGTGTGTRAGAESWTDTFALPAVPGVLTERELVALATAYRGQTAIRLDAQVVWLPARPAAERVPADAAVVTVTPVFGSNSNSRAERLDHAFTVTDPAKVARIVAVVNGLTRFPDGAYSCPADFGGQMRLTFSTRAGGPVLARLTAPYGGCGSVSFRLGGRNMPALSEYPVSGPPLQQQVLASAGVNWPVRPGNPS